MGEKHSGISSLKTVYNPYYNEIFKKPIVEIQPVMELKLIKSIKAYHIMQFKIKNKNINNKTRT